MINADQIRIAAQAYLLEKRLQAELAQQRDTQNVKSVCTFVLGIASVIASVLLTFWMYYNLPLPAESHLTIVDIPLVFFFLLNTAGYAFGLMSVSKSLTVRKETKSEVD